MGSLVLLDLMGGVALLLQGTPALTPAQVKFALQYTIYSKFNGGTSNYDGFGRSASDNNTLYLEAWIAL